MARKVHAADAVVDHKVYASVKEAAAIMELSTHRVTQMVHAKEWKSLHVVLRKNFISRKEIAEVLAARNAKDARKIALAAGRQARRQHNALSIVLNDCILTKTTRAQLLKLQGAIVLPK